MLSKNAEEKLARLQHLVDMRKDINAQIEAILSPADEIDPVRAVFDAGKPQRAVEAPPKQPEATERPTETIRTEPPRVIETKIGGQPVKLEEFTPTRTGSLRHYSPKPCCGSEGPRHRRGCPQTGKGTPKSPTVFAETHNEEAKEDPETVSCAKCLGEGDEFHSVGCSLAARGEGESKHYECIDCGCETDSTAPSYVDVKCPSGDTSHTMVQKS